jgi:hypothetical protein
MSTVLVGALFLDGDLLSFSKSADFKAVPVEAEKGMYKALVQLFENALVQLDAEQNPPADETPAPEAA